MKKSAEEVYQFFHLMCYTKHYKKVVKGDRLCLKVEMQRIVEKMNLKKSDSGCGSDR